MVLGLIGKKIVKNLGVDDVRFHDLRHTHATVMLLQGVHLKVVQERLGHSKMSTTMDIYATMRTFHISHLAFQQLSPLISIIYVLNSYRIAS